jgi:hypothetical protein
MLLEFFICCSYYPNRGCKARKQSTYVKSCVSRTLLKHEVIATFTVTAAIDTAPADCICFIHTDVRVATTFSELCRLVWCVQDGLSAIVEQEFRTIHAE